LNGTAIEELPSTIGDHGVSKGFKKYKGVVFRWDSNKRDSLFN
jgi:hypothetical protein